MIRDDPDGLLVERLKGGDDTAFGELLERYRRKAISMAYHMVGNLEDAEDISQEAFVLVYTKVKGFRGESSFRTWFYKVIVNLCRSHNRRRRLLKMLTLGSEGKSQGSSEIEMSQTEAGMEDEKGELKRAIGEAIHSLPARQREVFVMKHLQGMKIHEIAMSLNCAEGTVKAHLFRAVKELQKGLKDYGL